MANLNILDIAKLNGTDEAITAMIEETVEVSPELSGGDTKTIAGTSYKQLVRTALPAVGFRSLNEGVATTKATYELRETQCYLCDAGSEVDEAMEQASDEPLSVLLANEMEAKVESYMRGLSTQFYYGREGAVGATSDLSSPLKGFNGLHQLYDSSNMEIDRGAVSGTYTSVWLVKWGKKYVRWVAGEDGLFKVGETKEVRLTDGSDNPYDGLRKALKFWVGLQCNNPRNSMVRIKKIDGGTSPTAGLRDADIYKALALFPGGIMPDVIYLTQNARESLRGSRTATTTTGTPAPLPTEVAGVPLVVTDGISEAETS